MLNKLTINEIFCLAAIAAVCYFTAVSGHDLWTADEPRVGAIALEMANTGNFVVPHLAGAPFVEKPPLYFSAAALMIKLMVKPVGPLTNTTAAIRLTSMLFSLGILLMTFLITRRLWETRTAIWAAAILATMAGFIENANYIRVDAALAFFVAAGIWCFVEGFLSDKKWLISLAGLFLAGAFLSKGPIGIILVAPAWAGLTVIWLFPGRAKDPTRDDQADQRAGRRIGSQIVTQIIRLIIDHLGLILIFGLVAGGWALVFYHKGGPELWHEWFWENQVGRFTGQAAKGHIKPGQPFYYVGGLAGYGMPWTPLIFYWFGVITWRMIKRRGISRQEIFLYIWGVGSIVLLSLPATKRSIYLLPALPVFAIMSAASLKQLTSRWFSRYAGFWVALCLIILSAIVLLPLAPGLLPADAVPAAVKAVLVKFSCQHFIAGAWLALGLLVVIRFRRAVSAEAIMVIITAGLFVGLLGAPVKALDQGKSLAGDVRQFVSQVPEVRRDRIAGFGLSETMRGALYYYTGWRVPLVTADRMAHILTGQDPAYDSVLINFRNRHGDLNLTVFMAGFDITSYAIIARMATGTDQEREMFWIRGASGAAIAANDSRPFT